jgi:hypothetical protein
MSGDFDAELTKEEETAVSTDAIDVTTADKQ